MPSLKYLFFSIFLIFSLNTYGSAICDEGTKDGSSIGLWNLKFENSEYKNVKLVLEKNESFFSGNLIFNLKRPGITLRSISIPIQACEGDCCNGFDKDNFQLNFYNTVYEDKSIKFGRLSFRGKVNWTKKTLTGEFFDTNLSLISRFEGSKSCK